MQAIDIILTSARQLWEGALAHLPSLVVALVVVGLTALVARGARRVAWGAFVRLRLRETLRELFLKLVNLGVWVVGLLLAGTAVLPDLTVARILSVLGLGSVAVGFAFKDLFENFLSGVLLMLREPFRLGDLIECQGQSGTVEEITIRDTCLRQPDGQRIVMPNGLLFKNPIRILTDQKNVRTSAVCGIGYGDDLTAARELIARTIKACETVCPSLPVDVMVEQLGPSSVDLQMRWWTQARGRLGSRDEVIAAVKGALDKAGFELPGPQRTLAFAGPVTVRRYEEERSSPKPA